VCGADQSEKALTQDVGWLSGTAIEQLLNTVGTKHGDDMERDGKHTHLKRLREVAGLSQYELARLSGIARNRLSLFECGYIQLQDEEYGLAEHVLRDALIERQQRLRTALSGDRVASTA
jgi:DNA-binding XRE family transcriptional regulator